MDKQIYCKKCDEYYNLGKLKDGYCPSCMIPLFKKREEKKMRTDKYYKSYKEYLEKAPKDSKCIELSYNFNVLYDNVLETYILWELGRNYKVDRFKGTRDKCVSYFFKKYKTKKRKYAKKN